ncbi:lipoprotein [Spiroplasma floricola]|uniref:Bifunctional chitinase/lysozyme n=1 Tax=Spiroplasma floricola 23-6 TaxID=1336749 RepID=A0A2K8SD15_9MOLU|nr:lipoprotein [Spiroplasma floricola]AUB31357.1 bifunctional chitinase/lysozyme [Spiroplasma floricola 23-6]
MKKLLSILGTLTLTSMPITSVVSCISPDPGNNFGDSNLQTGNEWKGKSEISKDVTELKSTSVKLQKSQDVLYTDYSNFNKTNYSASLSNTEKTSGYKNKLIKEKYLKTEDHLTFNPYADMGIVEDTAEYLMKDKGVGGASRADAEKWLEGRNNAVYNDVGEYATKYFNEGNQKGNGIKLGFMQNASDTGELVPMWNAAPSQGSKEGILATGKNQKEYARWFNDKYEKWTNGKPEENWQRPSEGGLNKEDVTISFGPFANSLWHTAYINNKTPEELATTIKAVGDRYGTKKFDFYFSSPYLTKSGQYGDSQRLLASALKILMESDSGYDITLSLVVSTKDGVAVQKGLESVKQIGDEAYPLWNFTEYLGMNFRLNLIPYLTNSSVNGAVYEGNWELDTIKKAITNTKTTWTQMYKNIHGNDAAQYTPEEISRRMSITPWIGRRAEESVYSFTTEDAAKLREFAVTEKLGQMSMFYISRDIPSLFEPNKEVKPGESVYGLADKNALDQNIRSGAGYKAHSFSDILSGKVQINEELKVEAKTKEDIKKNGGIDYKEDIEANKTLIPGTNGGWENPGVDPENPGGGSAGSGAGGGNIVPPTPPTGPGASLYTSWAQANPNRKTNITSKTKANGSTYFSPYLDAGLYEGNDIAGIKNKVSGFDNLTLSFVQQVNSSDNKEIDLSIAGIPNKDANYQYWEEYQLYGKMLKPMIDSNNFENIKVAYGGATTGGYVEKNPWDVALRMAGASRDSKASDLQISQATGHLEKALIKYQEDLVKVGERYSKKTGLKMPKSIDFDIEGHAQYQEDELKVLGQTMANMKKKDPSWDFSLTLPVLPTGLTSVGYNVMNIINKEFKAAGLSQNQVPIVNLMLMDYGDPIYVTAKANGETNFDLAKQAIENTRNNLATSLEENWGTVGVSGNKLYSLIGATPMIGVNDTVQGVFTLEDAKELYNYAQVRNLAYIGMWSMNDDRGRQGTRPVNKSLVTHGLAYLEEYDFARAFSGDWTNEVKVPRKEWKH